MVSCGVVAKKVCGAKGWGRGKDHMVGKPLAGSGFLGAGWLAGLPDKGASN